MRSRLVGALRLSTRLNFPPRSLATLGHLVHPLHPHLDRSTPLRAPSQSLSSMSVNMLNETSSISSDESIYQPQNLSPIPGAEKDAEGNYVTDSEDWTSDLELDRVKLMAKEYADSGVALKVLVLYGSLRERSFSRLMAFEAARILAHLGCHVRVYNPSGLPVKDEASASHPKVKELRELSEWSMAHFWCSPEQHGNLTAVFKNQIDWIPLSTGSVRPTQGRVLGFAQINGGGQSFNTVNSLRILGRWMRMFVIPNQSSLPMAWKAFTPAGRLMPSSNRDRLVDVCEELVKVTCILLPHKESLDDRYSEREEKRVKGRLLTQAEKEKEKDAKLTTPSVAQLKLVEKKEQLHDAHAGTPNTGSSS